MPDLGLNLTTTLLSALAFPEGPRWHEGRLWFSDMHAHEIVAVDAAGRRETVLSHAGPVSGLGWLPDGRLLFVSMEDRRVMRREADGRVVVHADLSGIATWHANDMVVDAQGRAYVGNFGFSLHPMGTPAPATLARVDPDGAVHAAAPDLMFPNGMVITPDGGTLVVGESFKGVLTAFDIGADGGLSHRRVWAQLPAGGVPDGCCLDADGCIWVASPTTKDVLRLREGGEVLERIATDQQAIACMLGGADGKTLFILTAADTDPAACAAHRTARIVTHRAPSARAGRPENAALSTLSQPNTSRAASVSSRSPGMVTLLQNGTGPMTAAVSEADLPSQSEGGQSEGERVALELREIMRSAKRGFLFRYIPCITTALISIPWVGWTMPLFVIAALTLHELVLFPAAYRRLMKPNALARPNVARAVLGVMLAIGGFLYMMGWAPLFFLGNTTGVFIASGWLWGTVIHNLTYFSRTRLCILATTLPQVSVVALGPFFMGFESFAPWAMLFLTAQTLGTVLISARDRQGLHEDAERDRAARREAEQANVAKSQFLATMSHELRTPLNAIIGYAEIIEEDLENAPEDASPDDARRIRRAARHLLTLINEVLDLSKIESGRLELINGPVDIAALLRDVEETVRPIGAGHGNIVTLDVVGAIPMLNTDGARLKQCLLNLATNACKFTKDGRVTIRAGLETRNGAQVLEIAVTDTGIGIKPEDQARLFTPFVQVDGSETRTQDGTGLGLVITRKLAQAMGGDVSLISTAGVGSTFTLWVAAVPVTESAPAPETGPLVLVIEDDPTARDLTCRALSRLSFNVRATASAAEGLAMLESVRPDLVILDIHLPDMSGWNVLERIKTMPGGQDLPVLVVTIDDDRARALALGACEHMVKPVDRDHLTAAAVRYALPKRAAAPAPQATPVEATPVAKAS